MMKYYVAIPFNVLTYRRILDNYWAGKSDNHGSLGFYKKSEKSKKYHKYFFGGRVPIGCLDYTPPFINPPSFSNFFTDWTPLYIDDMIVTFKTGEGERMCSKYIFMVDELRDNEIIIWGQNGGTMVGAFNAETGGVSVAIRWDLMEKDRKFNYRLLDSGGDPDKLKKPEKPKLLENPEFIVDPYPSIVPLPVDWSKYSRLEGFRGIDFAGTIQKGVLRELVEKRIKTWMITLKRLLKKGDIEKAVILGNWINRLKEVVKNCYDDFYRI